MLPLHWAAPGLQATQAPLRHKEALPLQATGVVQYPFVQVSTPPDTHWVAPGAEQAMASAPPSAIKPTASASPASVTVPPELLPDELPLLAPELLDDAPELPPEPLAPELPDTEAPESGWYA